MPRSVFDDPIATPKNTHLYNLRSYSSSSGVHTAVNCVVVAHAVQHLPAPTAGVPCAAPGVVVIGTGAGFHLLLQDHPTDTTLNLRCREMKQTERNKRNNE